jgi:hypothetical protein
MRTRLLPLLLVGAIPAAGGGPEADPERFHKTVFFAVLEGLYEDGVATEDVDTILRRDPKTRYFENFVEGCPICDPARDAFQVYRGRPVWTYKTVPRDTFGRGPDEATRAALWSEDPTKRFPAIEGLVRAWVGRRLAMQRLTDAERKDYARAFEEMRKEGMSRISGGAPSRMKACALCDGAFGGAGG